VVVVVDVVPLPGTIVSTAVVAGPAIVVLVDVVVGTVVVVVPLGGTTVVVVAVVVAVVVVVVVVGGSLLVGGVSTVSGTVVVVVESSGFASAIEPGSAISATTAGATARSRFERDTMLIDLTPDQRDTRVYGASSSACAD